jgi:hypothetical protein
VASEPGESPEEGLEHFAPTSGRILGVLGLLLAAAVLVAWALDRDSVPAAVAAAALAGGVLVWASMLRPRVSASRETLHLRNMLETVRIPLAAIDELLVRQVLTVRVGERKFVSPAVGRKLRKVMGASRRGGMVFGPELSERVPQEFEPVTDPGRPQTDVDYVDHVERRLRDLVAEARTRHGVRAYSDEAEALAAGVHREPAWPEIGALAVAILLLVIALAL